MRNGDAVFTEKLDATGSPDLVKLQNELVQLDHAWEFERQKCLVRFKRNYHEPGLFDFGIWTAFTLLGLSFIFGSTGPKGNALHVILGILIAGCSIAKFVDVVQKAARLKAGRPIYDAKRKALRAALVAERRK
jgi:cytochrome c biogenesis protein CcdA